MTVKSVAKAGVEPAACGVGAQGFKCAIVSWVAPLMAFGVLIAGLRYPLVSGFNILVVAFGVTATLRSLAHVRRFGACGLGGHVAVGVVLNLAVIVLVVIYLFTAFDPFGLRP